MAICHIPSSQWLTDIIWFSLAVVVTFYIGYYGKLYLSSLRSDSRRSLRMLGCIQGGCCSDTAKGIEFHTRTHAQELSRLRGIFSGSRVPTTCMMSCTVLVLMKLSFYTHPRQYLSLMFIFCRMIGAFFFFFFLSYFPFSYKSSASM